MTNEEIKNFIEAKGWTLIGNYKNQYMMSFYKGEIRLNYYFVTGNLSIDIVKQSRPMETKMYNRADTKEKIEEILKRYEI